jgi:hypothetical protein
MQPLLLLLTLCCVDNLRRRFLLPATAAFAIP